MQIRVFSLLLVFAIYVNAKNKKNENDGKDPPAKIAIIGGGIAGSSAAYFLREKFGVDVQIDLFEKNERLCGRLATVNIGGSEYESGGSIIHGKNLYMKSFQENLGLDLAESYSGGVLGIFDGTEYVLRSSSSFIIAFLQKLWLFGLSLFRLGWRVEDFMAKFERIYDLQARNECFDDVTALLYAMGGDDFVHATQTTARQSFSDAGISKFMIDNLISPGIRVNYGQNAEVNGFVGAVSMAGTQSGLWSVKGGNKQVCYKLVENSSTNVVREEVERVNFDEKATNGKFTIMTKQSPSTPRNYDIIVVAAPIERDMYHINISEACSDVEKCPSSKKDEENYRRTVANFVKGKLNSSLFQCNSWKECPSFIMVPNEDTFYRSIGLHVPVDYNQTTDNLDPIYKVFTTEPLTDEQRNYLFESYTDTATVDWMAYPYYSPPEKLTSFVLNEAGLYYTSPIEWSASAMEMSVISAKNAALLAHKKWFSIPESENVYETEKVEL